MSNWNDPQPHHEELVEVSLETTFQPFRCRQLKKARVDPEIDQSKQINNNNNLGK